MRTQHMHPLIPHPQQQALQPKVSMLVSVSLECCLEGLSIIEISNRNIGFLLLFMGVLCLVFLICSLRTNIVYVVVFATLVAAFGLLTGEHFQLAVGNTDLAASLQVVCSS